MINMRKVNDCYSRLQYLADYFHAAETKAREEHRVADEQRAHDRYNLMLEAASVLVKEFDL